MPSATPFPDGARAGGRHEGLPRALTEKKLPDLSHLVPIPGTRVRRGEPPPALARALVTQFLPVDVTARVLLTPGPGGESMNPRALCTLLVLLAQTTTGAAAMADVPACPAWAGGYVATVDGGSVTVCPTPTPPPGWQSTACPFTTGMVRVDVSTGTGTSFLGPCVANPAGDGSGDAGTPCYLDPCVPPGTYEYGYQIPAFTGCSESCAGPTSGEWATVVTVSSNACAEDAGAGGPLGSLVIWRDVDAAVVDGAVTWSGTCTGPLPGPDGGYCAWEWLDGSAQWAPCPPDGGTLCPGYTADGSAIPVACPTAPDGDGLGSANVTNGNGGGDDGGATAAPAETPAAATGGGHGGGGCAVSSGKGGGGAAYVALAALVLVIRIRGQRRRRRAATTSSGSGRI
jgi:MYXO-CTERM domain-containing protein